MSSHPAHHESVPALKLSGGGAIAERRIAELEAALERARAEMEEFASVTAHDLKEPLRGIHNFVSFVLEDDAGKLSPESVDKLRCVQKLAQRAESLLTGLMRIARVPRDALRLADVRLDSLAADTLRSLRPVLEPCGARVDIAPHLGVARCDPAAIAEVLSQVVLNAAQFNEQEERRISISAAPHSPGDLILLMIEDNGIGIAERHRELVFRMFKRLHARDRYGGGIGAGLTICRRIVERHGGTMWIEPSETGGTRVCFTLPRAEGVVHGGKVSHPDR